MTALKHPEVCYRCGHSDRGPLMEHVGWLCESCATGKRPTTYVEPQPRHRPLITYTQLDPELVTELRERWAEGTWSKHALAQRYGMDARNVGRVVERRSWQHIPMGPLEATAILDSYAPEAVTAPPIPEGPAATVVPTMPDAPWNQYVGRALVPRNGRVPHRRSGWE